MINFLSFSIFTLMMAAGQALFKKVGLSIRGMPISDGLMSVLTEPALYIALALYGVATLLWIWILSRVALSEAYPWVAVGIVIVPLLGCWLYGERVAPIFWVGAACIVIGVILTQYGSQSL